jgi:16S rRNA processing protein RimM
MVIMGRIAGAQGIQGWVKLKTYTEFADSLTAYNVWWLGNGEQPWREITVENHAVQSKGLIARFSGCHDRTAAEQYRGLLVAVPRSSLPPQAEDEYYWSDLMGMDVLDLAGNRLGVVDSLMDTGANHVLCVRTDDGKKSSDDLLIPFIANAIKQVDTQNKVIHVDWAADWAEKH